jgi:NAD(P)H-dependent FMN reductase/predicted MFS family arabinose efflux permease
VVATGFAMTLTAPIELLYAEDFGLGAIGVAAFFVTTALGMLAVDTLGARIVPHLDARTTLVGGTLVFAAATLTLGLAPGAAVLFAGRVLQGAGAGIVISGGLQAAVRVTASRSQALGTFNSCFLIGTALGAPVGGALADAAGFVPAFVLSALAAVGVAVGHRTVLPPLAPVTTGRARLGLPRLGRQAGLGAALVLATTGDFLWGGVVYTALPLVGDDRGFGVAAIGLAVGLLSAVEIVVLRSSPRLFTRLGRGDLDRGVAPALGLALAVGIGSLAVLTVTRSWAAYLGATAVLGVAVAAAIVAPPLLLVELSDEPGQALATSRISAGAGWLVGSTAIALLAGPVGPSTVLGLSGVVLAGAVVLTAVVGRRVAQSSGHAPDVGAQRATAWVGPDPIPREATMNIAVVVGNPKPRSRTHEAALAVAEALGGAPPAVVIDVVELGAGLLGWGDPAVSAAVESVQKADVVVVASPTFKATYTGLLKLFLDQVPADGLAGVVAVPVMLGAGPGHLLAPDLLLKPVLVELGATCPTKGLYLLDSDYGPGALAPWLAAARSQVLSSAAAAGSAAEPVA